MELMVRYAIQEARLEGIQLYVLTFNVWLHSDFLYLIEFYEFLWINIRTIIHKLHWKRTKLHFQKCWKKENHESKWIYWMSLHFEVWNETWTNWISWYAHNYFCCVFFVIKSFKRTFVTSRYESYTTTHNNRYTSAVIS